MKQVNWWVNEIYFLVFAVAALFITGCCSQKGTASTGTVSCATEGTKLCCLASSAERGIDAYTYQDISSRYAGAR